MYEKLRVAGKTRVIVLLGGAMRCLHAFLMNEINKIIAVYNHDLLSLKQGQLSQSHTHTKQTVKEF